MKAILFITLFLSVLNDSFGFSLKVMTTPTLSVKKLRVSSLPIYGARKFVLFTSNAAISNPKNLSWPKRIALATKSFVEKMLAFVTSFINTLLGKKKIQIQLNFGSRNEIQKSTVKAAKETDTVTSPIQETVEDVALDSKKNVPETRKLESGVWAAKKIEEIRSRSVSTAAAPVETLTETMPTPGVLSSSPQSAGVVASTAEDYYKALDAGIAAPTARTVQISSPSAAVSSSAGDYYKALDAGISAPTARTVQISSSSAAVSSSAGDYYKALDAGIPEKLEVIPVAENKPLAKPVNVLGQSRPQITIVSEKIMDSSVVSQPIESKPAPVSVNPVVDPASVVSVAVKATSVNSTSAKTEINPSYMIYETGAVDPNAVWAIDEMWRKWVYSFTESF